MKRIYKYVFELNDVFSILMPGVDPKVLKIGKQDGRRNVYCMWALVDPEATDNRKKEFRVYGTGQNIPFSEQSKYIDSIIDGIYVWHFFERE